MTARAQVELPGSDIDVMRDVYMTGTQRKAFDSILARLAESEARAEGDARLIDFLDGVHFEVSVRNGRKYQCGPNSGARTILEMARAYHTAIAQEAEREAGSA